MSCDLAWPGGLVAAESWWKDAEILMPRHQLAVAERERSRRQRAAALDQMVADAEDAGLYDLPDDVPFERLPIEGSGE